MGASIWQLLVFLIFFFIPALASVFILNKAGYSRWLAILMAIPIVNAVMIWVFANASWPALNKNINHEKKRLGESNTSNQVMPEHQITADQKHGYEDIPWYRRSDVNSFMILLSFLTGGFIPGVLLVCIFVLTGEIYLKEQDEGGDFKTWGWGNKIIAAFLLLLNIIAVVYILK